MPFENNTQHEQNKAETSGSHKNTTKTLSVLVVHHESKYIHRQLNDLQSTKHLLDAEHARQLSRGQEQPPPLPLPSPRSRPAGLLPPLA